MKPGERHVAGGRVYGVIEGGCEDCHAGRHGDCVNLPECDSSDLVWLIFRLMMPVRCGECTIIYDWTEAPDNAPAGAESTGLCAVCGPRACREADAMPAGALLGCGTGH